MKLPMTLALLGGSPERFLPLVKLYRQSAGPVDAPLPLAINSHFYVADDAQQAGDEFFPTYQAMMNRIGRERGWAPLNREQFEDMRQHGPLLVGSPQQIIDKLLRFHELFQNSRYMAQLIGGPQLDHARLLHAIELFGTKIAPVVREELSSKLVVNQN